MSDFKEKLAAIEDLQSVEVEIPEWGMTIELREPTSAEARAIRKKYVHVTTKTERDGKEGFEIVPHADLKDMDGYNCAMLAASMYHNGERCFNDESDAARFLGQKSERVVNKLIAAIQGLSRKALDADDAEKNSEPTPED